MKVHKVKRPGGVYTFDVAFVEQDGFGAWLHAAQGSAWHAPNDAGNLSCDVLVLIDSDHCWVAWWVDDPADRRLEIDVCLHPARVDDGWRFVDLELDPIRHADGTIEVEDHDELDESLRRGWMTAADGELARATAADLAAALARRDAPFGDEGWQRLDRLRAR